MSKINKRNTKFTDEFSKEVFEQTYMYEGEKDVNDRHMAIAKDLASVEKDKEYWTEKFLDILEDFKFMPGGRITSNAGTGLKGTTYINCFVSGFRGENQDSMEGIMAELTRQAFILKSEGGYGFCVDTLRPRGTFVRGIGSDTPGSVKMLEMWDKQSEVITSGSGKKREDGRGKKKIRKGAQMVTLSCWHPDIEEFITAKQTPGRLTKFNMSVLISDEFMDAVEKNKPWRLEFPDIDKAGSTYNKEWLGNLKEWKDKGHPVVVYKEFENANILWDMIMQSTYGRNEPGVLFIDTINRMNNLYYCEYINATNPCLTGDTLVYVADGRGYVTFKELAEQGRDVDVFCLDKDGKLAIRRMVNPRVTGRNMKVYKMTLDDGTVIKGTENHRFIMKDGTKKKLIDMKPGDSLDIATRVETSLRAEINHHKNTAKYFFLRRTGSTMKAEHTYIAEHNQGGPIPSGHVVHHIDFDSKNNAPSNLRIMTREAHTRLHADEMLGDKNPMRRAQTEWSEEKWAKYRSDMSEATGGDKNGRFSGISNEEIKKHALLLTRKLQKRFTHKDWMVYAREVGIPEQFSKWRNENLFGGLVQLAKWAAESIGLKDLDIDPRSALKRKELEAQGYTCRVTDGRLWVIKECSVCGKQVALEPHFREYRTCSSQECVSKQISIKNSNRSQEHREYMSKLQIEIKEPQKKENKEKQLRIYSELKFTHGTVSRKQWENECKKQGVPFRLGKHSPFKGFRELQKEAEFYNHKVVSVDFFGYADVYNGTVDDFHNYLIGGNDRVDDEGRLNRVNLISLNCGEQLLPPAGACLLGSLNLTQFIDVKNQDWDFDKLKEVISIAVRLMDNVNDKTLVPLVEQKTSLLAKRRIGLGYLGYASALMMIKVKYGSKKAIELTESLGNFVMNEAYKASALIAKEKGAFLAYDEDKYLKSNFVKGLDKETIKLIKKHGMRNSHLLSIQPTGNSSVFANNVSGGLEPIFLSDYIRTSIQPYPPEGMGIPKDVDWANKKYIVIGGDTAWDWKKEGDEDVLVAHHNNEVWKFDKSRGLLKETRVRDYAVRYHEENGTWDKDAKWAATTFNLSIDDHIATMKVFSKYVDSAMSKTVNIPQDYSYDDFKRLYMEVFKTGTIKGCTSYRDGTMTSVLAAESTASKGSVQKSGITRTVAVERPKSVPCDVHQLTVGGEKWVVIVGLYENDPYEVFAMKQSRISIPPSLKKGIMHKPKSGRYDLETEDGWFFNDIENLFETNEQEALTRMISMGLRHGADIEAIVSQLQKAQGTIVSFSKAIARTLKKYITEIKTMKCSECGSKNLKMQEGCFVCSDCGSSKCE